jgi:hypothetical protein
MLDMDESIRRTLYHVQASCAVCEHTKVRYLFSFSSNNLVD